MARPLPELLSADRPIESLRDDRLHREHFASSVGRVLQDWKGRDSLIIALYGRWGSGKTSLKNMIVEAIASKSKEGEKSTEILHFNPWEWTGHTDLTTAFFSEVSKALGRPKNDEKAAKAAKGLLAHAAFLALNKEVLEGVPKLAINLILLISAAGFGASLTGGLTETGSIFTALGFGVIALTTILGVSESVLTKIANWRKSRLEANEQTLSERKKALSDLLRNLQRNVLVIVDDIDRLTKQEIRTVFQLVKANADFPNFVYFLPFQKDLVAFALDEGSNGEGDQFLEKIVQIGFQLPAIGQADVDGVVDEKLTAIFDSEIKGSNFDTERWSELYFEGLRFYFQDLRRVNKFVSSLAFHVELLRKDGTLEVNPIDLIAVEVIRLFEIRIYELLRTSTDLFVGQSQYLSAKKPDLKEQIEAILSQASSPKHVKSILQHLFPNLGFAFDEMSSEESHVAEWRGALRICVEEFYPRYFQLAIPESDLSQAEVLEMVSLSGEPSLLERLYQFERQGRLVSAMDRLEGNIDKINLDSHTELIKTLISINENIPHSVPGFFSVDPTWTVERMVRKLLEKEKDPVIRAKIFMQALTESEGMSLPTSLITSTLKAFGERNMDRVLFNENDLLALRDQCVSKIRALAASGVLLRQRDFVHILYRWSEWATVNEVREWAIPFVEGAGNVFPFLKHFVQASSSSDGKRTKIKWFIRLKNVEQFVDLNRLQELLKHTHPNESDPDAQRALVAFQEAISRRNSGRSEDRVWDD